MQKNVRENDPNLVVVSKTVSPGGMNIYEVELECEKYVGPFGLVNNKITCFHGFNNGKYLNLGYLRDYFPDAISLCGSRGPVIRDLFLKDDAINPKMVKENFSGIVVEMLAYMKNFKNGPETNNKLWAEKLNLLGALAVIASVGESAEYLQGLFVDMIEKALENGFEIVNEVFGEMIAAWAEIFSQASEVIPVIIHGIDGGKNLIDIINGNMDIHSIFDFVLTSLEHLPIQ